MSKWYDDDIDEMKYYRKISDGKNGPIFAIIEDIYANNTWYFSIITSCKTKPSFKKLYDLYLSDCKNSKEAKKYVNSWIYSHPRFEGSELK